MKIRPLGDRVLLEKIIKEEKTVSGIILSKADQELPEYAKIVEISKDLKKLPFKVGDQVIYNQYQATNIKDQDKEYIVIKAEEILAIIE